MWQFGSTNKRADNVVSFTQIANINAEGVLSINEEELILLMAA
jgi:hypothetical protein